MPQFQSIPSRSTLTPVWPFPALASLWLHVPLFTSSANADPGDSSIHLLVDETDITKPVVKRSVLIDGGWESGVDKDVYGKLVGILNEIGKIYTWPEAYGYYKNQPAFDAIVISKHKLASMSTRQTRVGAGTRR